MRRIPFRAENWSKTRDIYCGMFCPVSWNFPGIDVKELLLFVAGLVIVLFFKPVCEIEKRFRPTWVNAIIATGLIVVSMFFFVKYSPFIYFNF